MSDLIALLTALLTAVGAVIAILVFRGDRAELRELESVTALINMKSSRDAELRATQKRLLDRYLRGSKRRASGSTWLAWSVVFGGIGAIALLVAAIGIANTMAMSILERTREIGLMKAVGATNRDVLAIFLGEAAGIGFLGGLGGVIVGWLASQGINVSGFP